MTGEDRWRGRLRSPVMDVQTFWEKLAVGLAPDGSARVAGSYRVDVPAALRIDFAAGPVWMVAGIPKAPEVQEVFVPGDDIMVVFSAERMRKIGSPDSDFVTASRVDSSHKQTCQRQLRTFTQARRRINIRG